VQRPLLVVPEVLAVFTPGVFLVEVFGFPLELALLLEDGLGLSGEFVDTAPGFEQLEQLREGIIHFLLMLPGPAQSSFGPFRWFDFSLAFRAGVGLGSVRPSSVAPSRSNSVATVSMRSWAPERGTRLSVRACKMRATSARSPSRGVPTRALICCWSCSA